MSTRNPRVIIIGAGPSGLAAAQRLLDKGVDDLIILEAQDRFGGRIRSVEFEGSFADLGAQWCHGGGNVVYDMVKDLDLLAPSFNCYDDYTFYQADGEILDKSITDQMFQLAYEVANDNEALKDFKGSFGTYFIERFKDSVIRKYGNNAAYLKIVPLICDWYEKLVLCLCTGDSWFDISAKGLTHYKECEGSGYYNWKTSGYVTFLHVLMNKYPKMSKLSKIEEQIHYLKEVTKIDWTENKCNFWPVTVICSDGSFYNADHVIVTVSLGVLKDKCATLFHPELPLVKKAAINSLGFGTVNKILLKFPSKWWPDDCKGFNLVWRDEDRQKLAAEFPQDISEDGKMWIEDVFDFFVIDSHPEVLLVWMVGPSAVLIESKTDEEIIEGCMFLLQQFVSNKHPIQNPTAVLRSNWYSNPYTRGSYSFRSMETEKQGTSAQILSQPLVSEGKEVVLFAGEATHSHYYSTVHGAVEAGFREADRILSSNRVSNQLLCKVAIVGAGIAGLGAAITLCEGGCSDIIILEAQDRIGGRIQTLDLEVGHIELGAQWIHGDQNPLYRLAADHDLISSERSGEASGSYIRDDGFVFDEFLVKQVDWEIGKILEECKNFVDSTDYPYSLGHYLEEKYLKYLQQCEDSSEIRNMKMELYHWNIKFQMVDNSCESLKQISAKNWGKYECPTTIGREHINLKKGYKSLIDIIAQQLPSNIIKLNSPISKISWKNIDRKVILTSNNGSKIIAEHVIVTVSMGVLKNSPELFCPPLPSPIKDSSTNLGFSAIGKVFLIFENRWWENEGIQLIWRDEAHIDIEMEWAKSITGFDSVFQQPNVLLGWIGGDGLKVMEELSEEIIGNHCVHILRRFMKNDKIPQPIKVIKSSWSTSPWIRGGYSYTTPNCDSLELGPSNLCKPVLINDTPKILLAGEACHPTHFSTTHGAFESGQRQAQSILDYMK